MSVGTYSDFLTAVGQIESGNNYSFVSWPGYLGRYQFGEEALKAVGFYNGDNTSAIDFIGSWSATAASYGVTDKASFLASPAAQDAAMSLWVTKIVADLDMLGLRQYDGHVINGVDLTTSGLIAGAHLVGAWNLQSYLQSGGAVDPVDPNGEPVSDYIRRFNDFDTPYDNSASSSATSGSTGATSTQTGGPGPDTITGGSGRNALFGGDGNDSIIGGSAFNQINGNKGDDTIVGHSTVGDWLSGGQGNDLIDASGSSGGNIVNGNLGDDTVVGGSGADSLRGGQGDDVLHGGAGNDWLSGDLGNDTLTGGGGADTFRAFNGGGNDVITDFNAAEGDRVQVDPGSTYTLSQSGANTVIGFASGNTTVLAGVTLSSLPSGWIFGG